LRLILERIQPNTSHFLFPGGSFIPEEIVEGVIFIKRVLMERELEELPEMDADPEVDWILMFQERSPAVNRAPETVPTALSVTFPDRLLTQLTSLERRTSR
jgi:hypothetical protein